MIYHSNFINALNEIAETNNCLITDLLRTSIIKDIDIIPYFIDISENEGMIKFLPKKTSENIKFVDNSSQFSVLNGHKDIMMELFGFTQPNNPKNSSINLREPFSIKKIEHSRNFQNLRFYLVENETGEYVIYSDKRFSLEFVGNDLKFQEMKIGRFTRSLLEKIGYKPNDKEIETFVNKYIANLFIYSNSKDLFKTVEGEDIRKWYHEKMYHSGNSSLGKSCMRYDNCQGFFKIYEENQDKCKMLILEKDGKILGRTLLWTIDSGELYMDRVYTSKDSIANVFKTHAIDNKILYMNGYRSSSDDREVLVFKNDIDVTDTTELKITLNKSEFEKYPYMDTFRFLKDNTLSSTKFRDVGEYKDLINTNGTYCRRSR